MRVFTCIWTSDIEFHKLKFITRNNFDIKVKRNVIRRHCFRTIMTKTRIKCDSPKRIGWEEIWKRKGDQWRYQSPFSPLFRFIENTFLIQNTNWLQNLIVYSKRSLLLNEKKCTVERNSMQKMNFFCSEANNHDAEYSDGSKNGIGSCLRVI